MERKTYIGYFITSAYVESEDIQELILIFEIHPQFSLSSGHLLSLDYSGHLQNRAIVSVPIVDFRLNQIRFDLAGGNTQHDQETRRKHIKVISIGYKRQKDSLMALN